MRVAEIGSLALSEAKFSCPGAGYLPLATGLTPYDARSSKRSRDAGRESS
jgi:hypothetical protein